MKVREAIIATVVSREPRRRWVKVRIVQVRVWTDGARAQGAFEEHDACNAENQEHEEEKQEGLSNFRQASKERIHDDFELWHFVDHAQGTKCSKTSKGAQAI